MKNIIQKASKLNRKVKKLILILIDAAIIIFALLFSLYLRLEKYEFIFSLKIWILLFFIILVSIIIFNISGIYQNITRFISNTILKKIIVNSIFSSLILISISYLFDFFIPRSIPLMYFFLLVLCKSYVRFTIRFIYNNYIILNRKNVAIFGAENESIQFSNLLNKSTQYKLVAFFDKSSDLIGSSIDGIKIFSFEKDFYVLKEKNIKIVFLTNKHFLSYRQKILEYLKNYTFEIKKIPNLQELLNDERSLNKIPSFSINDLLGRQATRPHKKLLEKNVQNKVIFISGAGGSIGSEICKQIVELKPKKIILFESSEFALYQIYEELKDIASSKNYYVKLIAKLGLIQDEKEILNIFNNHKVNTIFHAAAYKHVSLVESNPFEAIKNNIFGTQTLSKCAVKAEVKNFTLISTDKAVRPTSIMGASKRLAEIICQSLAFNQNHTIFSIVRFGNVLDSSGSVIPLFRRQIQEGGPVTVTDKNVVRYFMTKSESAQLVIQASALAKGGEIFLLDMGKPIKIYDLATQMIVLEGYEPSFQEKNYKSKEDNKIEIKLIGLQKGEKLFEEMFIGDNYRRTTHPRIFSAVEENIFEKDLRKILKNLSSIINDRDYKKLIKFLNTIPIGFKS